MEQQQTQTQKRGITLKYPETGEVAIVKINTNGDVVVVRDGEETGFDSKPEAIHVVEHFVSHGWDLEGGGNIDPVGLAARQNDVTFKEQEDIEEYLTLHQEISDLKSKLDKLKKKLKPIVQEKGPLVGSNGKQLEIQDAAKTNSTSEFSDYELKPVGSILGPLTSQVTEIRVSSTKVESLIGLGKLTEDQVKRLREAKIRLEGTPRLVVKK